MKLRDGSLVYLKPYNCLLRKECLDGKDEEDYSELTSSKQRVIQCTDGDIQFIRFGWYYGKSVIDSNRKAN